MTSQQPKCIFCRIASGEVESEKLYEDELLFVVKDITPQAPTHLLVIPREHIVSLAETRADHAELLGGLLSRARDVAQQLGLANGYRLIINTGTDAGQSVAHLHLHLVGGKPLGPMLPT